MKVSQLNKKSLEELHTELLNLLREQFNLRMQAANTPLKQTHLLKQIHQNIARIKTTLTLKSSVQ